MMRIRTISETGEPFEVIAVADSSARYTLEPVPRYGRALGGGRFTRGSWSTWSYRLKDQPGVIVEPAGGTIAGERPTRFQLDFGGEEPTVLVEAPAAEI